MFSHAAVVTDATEAALRAAMAGGGTVLFACDGTITLAGTITNTVDTTLDGTGHQVTISGNNNVGIFYVQTNVSFRLMNLNLANGKSRNGGAIFNAGGTLTLLNSALTQNSCVLNAFGDLTRFGEGGAVYNLGGTVNATNCTFSQNSAQQSAVRDLTPGLGGRGGALRNEDGLMNLQNCVFTRNTASGGVGWDGRVGWRNSGAGGGGLGGAIYNRGTLGADGCTFTSNSATGGQGGWYNDLSPGAPGADGGSAAGGAVYNSQGAMVLSGCLFASNSAAGASGRTGQAGYAWDYPPPQLYVPGGNGGWGGSALGGALYAGSPASLVNCTLVGNIATGAQGGQGGYAPTNLPAGNGGNGGDATAGLYLAANSTLTNCTIACNSGYAGTGGLAGTGQVPGHSGANGSADGNYIAGTLLNTLLVTNAPANCTGLVTDAGYNLSSDATPALTNVGSMNQTNPRLGLLAHNRGPTLTMAPLAGSPVIDAAAVGNAPLLDQRGFARPYGAAPDIGAVEFWPRVPFLLLSYPGAGDLNIRVAAGTPGANCRLLASSDLSNWTPVATNQVGNDGLAVFSQSPGVQRFYRGVVDY